MIKDYQRPESILSVFTKLVWVIMQIYFSEIGVCLEKQYESKYVFIKYIISLFALTAMNIVKKVLI